MKILSVIMLAFCTSIAISQTYTEIFDNRWGRGIANSKPAVVDLDNDGLLDVIVGEWGGMLRHFEQDTPNSSDFSLVTDTVNDIDVGRYSAPCFTDLDGDGLLDMIVGNSEGDLNHYEQNTPGSVLFSSISESFNEINVGYNAAPTFTDLDNDGVLDLIIGAGDGYFHHYKQDGENSLTFSVVTDTFNHINVGDFPVPVFTDLDGDGLLDFMVGCGNKIFHYEQNLSGSTEFTEISDHFANIYIGLHTAPCFTDLDGDDLLDLIIGECDGPVNHFEQDATHSLNFTELSNDFCHEDDISVVLYAAPSMADIDGNGLLDLLIGERSGGLCHYEQGTPGSSVFIFVSDRLNDIEVGKNAAPTLIDLNNNDLLDLVIGNWDGHLFYFEQNHPDSIAFTLVSDTLSHIDVSMASTPCFTDLNGDGCLDLIIGKNDGTLAHYQQNSVGSTEFTLLSESFGDVDVDMYSAPVFTDLDSDGLLDLIVGSYAGKIYHYEQNAAGALTFSMITDKFVNFQEKNSMPCFADINGDGLEDLIVGEYDGGVHYYQRNKDTHVENEQHMGNTFQVFKLYPNYPNPFNPETTIRFNVKEPCQVVLKVYNLLGQDVMNLIDQQYRPGSYKFIFNAAGLSSGIYFYRIQMNDFQAVKKMVILE